VNCVPLVTALIVVPAGIPVPVTFIPAYNPAVLATVTVLLAFVVAIPETVPGVTAKFAFPFNVTVVPEIAVTVLPKNAAPTSNPAGTLDTVTVGLDTLLEITLAATFNADKCANTPFAYNVPVYVFEFVRFTCAPVEIPPDESTGFTVPVITELIVKAFDPFVRNNSPVPEVNRPRTPADPIVRALLSDPPNKPPLASVNVSALPRKFT
jgi:hypothetical protein